MEYIFRNKSVIPRGWENPNWAPINHSKAISLAPWLRSTREQELIQNSCYGFYLYRCSLFLNPTPYLLFFSSCSVLCVEIGERSRWWPHEIQAQQTGMQVSLSREICVSTTPLNWAVLSLSRNIHSCLYLYTIYGSVYSNLIILVFEFVYFVFWGIRDCDEDNKLPLLTQSWGELLAESNLILN